MTFASRRIFAAALLLAAGAFAGCDGNSGDNGDNGTNGDPGAPGSAGPTGPAGPAAGGDAAAAFATKTPIKHVIVIFGENISFDHYFGTYPTAANLTGEPKFTALVNTPAANNLSAPLDVNNNFVAVTGGPNLLTANPNNTNTGNAASASNPIRLAPSQAATSDQGHNYQPEQQASNGGAMDLFPKFTGSTFAAPPGNSPSQSTSVVMGYYDGNTVTAMWNYAQHFALNDNSWSTQFGPSTPGAINLISGQTNGMVDPISGKTFDMYSASHVIADGQGGFTLIGDTDPLDDVCSTSTEQNHFSGKNIGDLLNASNITWGAFMGGFNLEDTNANGTFGCARQTNTTPTSGEISADYIPHHAWFQYYKSTANPTHARPSSIAAIGSSKAADGSSEPANHNYDSNDLFATINAGNLPAVNFVKAPAFQDAHAGYSNPIDEQNFVVSVVNAVANSGYWDSTAIIIAYDDSDGWYDHQAPPIVNPSSLVAINSPAGATDAIDMLNGAGVCNQTTAQQGKAVVTTALAGVGSKPVLGRCGYGTRQPLLVISPFAKQNVIDHTLTDQTSVLRFIEDNWLQSNRIGGGSFDALAGPIDNMFSFPAGSKVQEASEIEARKLVLDPETGRATGRDSVQ